MQQRQHHALDMRPVAFVAACMYSNGDDCAHGEVVCDYEYLYLCISHAYLYLMHVVVLMSRSLMMECDIIEIHHDGSCTGDLCVCHGIVIL
jgi:hypothetical protein